MICNAVTVHILLKCVSCITLLLLLFFPSLRDENFSITVFSEYAVNQLHVLPRGNDVLLDFL